jgi:hypothetical protein
VKASNEYSVLRTQYPALNTRHPTRAVVTGY